jgi:hypothetical protein
LADAKADVVAHALQMAWHLAQAKPAKKKKISL